MDAAGGACPTWFRAILFGLSSVHFVFDRMLQRYFKVVVWALVFAVAVATVSAQGASSGFRELPSRSRANVATQLFWSDWAVTVTLSPGERILEPIQFQSNRPLQGLRFETRPEGPQFISFHPSSMASIAAYDPQGGG